MTTPSNPDIVPQTGFDPIVFWFAHKTKIIAYAVLIIAVVVGYVIYQAASQHKIEEAQRTFAQASTEDDYRQITQKFPRTVISGNATLLLAKKLREAKKYDEAVAALKALIDQNPNYPLIDEAWLSLGATYEAQGKTDDALSTYQQVATTFNTRSSAPQAMLAQAEIMKSKGRFDEAKRDYENVKSQFPDSFFAAEAMQELNELKK